MSDDAVMRLRADSMWLGGKGISGFAGDDLRVVLSRLDAAERRASWAVEALREIKRRTPMILTGADTPAAYVAQRMGVIACAALAKIEEDAQ